MIIVRFTFAKINDTNNNSNLELCRLSLHEIFYLKYVKVFNKIVGNSLLSRRSSYEFTIFAVFSLSCDLAFDFSYSMHETE